MRQFFWSFIEIAEVVLVAFSAMFLIRGFLVQPFLVSGSSMVPNFSDGDYLLIDEVTYRFRAPERGEVVVFRYPREESVYFIKRVIGLPGERVQIKDGRVTVFNDTHPSGILLDEAYIPGGVATRSDGEFQIPKDSYFVLGDNRTSSFDSRSWGTVPKSDVIGLVQIRLWPPAAFRVFAAPLYGTQ